MLLAPVVPLGQMVIRGSCGTTFLNSSKGGQGMSPGPATAQLSICSTQKSHVGSLNVAGVHEAEDVA